MSFVCVCLCGTPEDFEEVWAELDVTVLCVHVYLVSVSGSVFVCESTYVSVQVSVRAEVSIVWARVFCVSICVSVFLRVCLRVYLCVCLPSF